jgi:hypothetical protein
LVTHSELASGGTGIAGQPDRAPGSGIEGEIPVDVVADRHGRLSRAVQGSPAAGLPVSRAGDGEQLGDVDVGAETVAAERGVGRGGRDARQHPGSLLQRDHDGCAAAERNRSPAFDPKLAAVGMTCRHQRARPLGPDHEPPVMAWGGLQPYSVGDPLALRQRCRSRQGGADRSFQLDAVPAHPDPQLPAHRSPCPEIG